MSIDLEAVRRRLDWLRDNEEQCQRSPGQVSMAGYAAAAIDCGRDVPLLLEELEALRTALADEQGSHAMTANSFEIFVESMAEQARAAEGIVNGLRAQLAALERSAVEHAQRHQQIFDSHLRQVSGLLDQRYEARDEVVRLGKALQRAADDQCGCLGTVDS